MIVYLLMEATGSWDDYTCNPIDMFLTKELADKAADGLNEISEYLESINWKDWISNASDYLYTCIENGTITDSQFEALMIEMDDISGIYVTYDYPTYSVQQLDVTMI